MTTLFFDAEVTFYPEVTKLAMEKGVDERRFVSNKFGPIIDAHLRYISHISFKRGKTGKVINLSVLDGTGALSGDANEKQLLSSFIEEWNKADEVVAFYGERFDRRFINSRIEKHNLPMLKPIRLIDPWRILKSNFLLANNKLDTAIKFFHCPYEKPALPWTVWQKVSFGVVKFIKILRNRCKYDVLSMAWLWYHHLQKYATTRVNRALAYELIHIDDDSIKNQLRIARCPRCAVKSKLIRKGYNYGKVTTTMVFKCKSCREWPSAPIKKNGSIGRLR